MATQRVWHEELQAWVYDDPDIPEDLDFDNLENFGISARARENANHDLCRAYLPLNILEGRSMTYE